MIYSYLRNFLNSTLSPEGLACDVTIRMEEAVLSVDDVYFDSKDGKLQLVVSLSNQKEVDIYTEEEKRIIIDYSKSQSKSVGRIRVIGVERLKGREYNVTEVLTDGVQCAHLFFANELIEWIHKKDVPSSTLH